MRKRKINMYDVILKNKKRGSYVNDKFLPVSFSSKNSNWWKLKFFMAQDITMTIDKDMEMMLNLMVKYILEGILDERKRSK